MGFFDIALMTMIIGGAVYLLYRSMWKNIWKKGGHCPGCESGGACGRKGRFQVK